MYEEEDSPYAVLPLSVHWVLPFVFCCCACVWLCSELENELRRRNMLSFVEVIPKARVPIIKFTDRQTGIRVDMCFDQSNGLAAVELINGCALRFPPFRPLVMLLKYFLHCRQLNDTFSGGVGSFLLQMLVLSHLQMHPARTSKMIVVADANFNLGTGACACHARGRLSLTLPAWCWCWCWCWHMCVRVCCFREFVVFVLRLLRSSTELRARRHRRDGGGFVL
jgi:hypothetical protein